MKNLARCFWIGFSINLFSAMIFSIVFNYLAYELLMVISNRDLMIVLYLIQNLLWGALAVVFVAAFLFSRWRQLSVWLMSIATLALLPVGAFLLHGILRSNSLAGFSKLASLSKKENMEWEQVYLYNSDKVMITCAVFLGPGLGLAFSSGSLPGIMLASIAAVFLYNGYRLHKRPVLAWTTETVVITPNLFSDPLLIPPVFIKEIGINEVEIVIDMEYGDRTEKIRLKKSSIKNADLNVLEQQFSQYLQRVNQGENELAQSE
ncbi:hypothetical protein [Buttiauxella sp.]|uniref:hypothetical protein n=1 Tax=Buttiauxella sp. TaxID=1972222 RepID=UPI003C78360C